MAGQIGLDPPTMTLCAGGPTGELEQALVNSEAVAKCFGASISTSAILLVIYCSKRIPSSERIRIQEKLDMFLKQRRSLQLGKESNSTVLDPVFLYVLAPDLPKRYSISFLFIVVVRTCRLDILSCYIISLLAMVCLDEAVRFLYCNLEVMGSDCGTTFPLVAEDCIHITFPIAQ